MQVSLDLSMHTAPHPEGLEPQREKYLKLSLCMNKPIVNNEPKNIFAMSDVSGSMSDICRDGKSKMEHIIHIWTNIIHYLAEHPEFNVALQLRGFDGNIHNYIDLTKVTKENSTYLIECVNKMRPMNTTNIEHGLNNLLRSIDVAGRNYSLLMTDGDVTSGERDKTLLASIMPENSHFAAIAFGTNHNAPLMNALGQLGPNTSNWLVSDLEHSGFVYAEIFAKWLYQLLDDVQITIENGLLYDWKTNTWTTVLNIGSLSAEEMKNFHVKSDTPYNVQITFRGTNIQTNEEYIEEVDLMPELIDSHTNIIHETDLTKDMFRLRAQELMYEAKNISPNISFYNERAIPPRPLLTRQTNMPVPEMCPSMLAPLKRQNAFNLLSEEDEYLYPAFKLDRQMPPPPPPPPLEGEPYEGVAVAVNIIDDVENMKNIKNTINSFKQVMIDYVNTNHLEDDEFLANLIADMEMTLSKIGTANQFMYIAARSSSQGRQQTQCVVDVDVDIAGFAPPPPLVRAQTNGAYASPIVLEAMRSLTAPRE